MLNAPADEYFTFQVRAAMALPRPSGLGAGWVLSLLIHRVYLMCALRVVSRRTWNPSSKTLAGPIAIKKQVQRTCVSVCVHVCDWYSIALVYMND